MEYFRELTKLRLMPDIDPKVALMVLKYYADLILKDDPNCDLMEELRGDNLMHRCVSVVAKHWQSEIHEPLLTVDEWPADDDKSTSSKDGVALHRDLPSKLQNYLLEKCILAAKDDVDAENAAIRNFDEAKEKEVEEQTKKLKQATKELAKAKDALGNESEGYVSQIEQLQSRTQELEAELEQKTKALEEYKQELMQFRRVPGIHNFGEVSKEGDAKIIDKTKCTYSANPDHNYPYHRRGNKRPTQMPSLGSEMDNLGKENGYLYDDGHGELLPVFYYRNAAI